MPEHHTSQDCCCPCLCPHSRPLLTHASAGDPQTLTGRSGSIYSGGHLSFPCAQGFVFASKSLWQVWGLILTGLCPSHSLISASPLSLDVECLFFSGFQHPPVNGCVAGRKPVLTPCWKLFLWLAFHCLYYYSSYTMACLEVPASLLDCKLKFSSWRQFVPDHLWIQEINTSLPKAGHSLGDVLEDWRPFHFTSPTASPSLFCPLTLVPHCFFLSDL